MNKSIKKVPCCGVGNRILLCAFILMVSCAAMPAYAAVGDTFADGGGINYNVLTEDGTNGTVEVGDNQSYGGNNLSIPATVIDNGITYDVVSVSDMAFMDNTGLTGTLTIPASVTSIGFGAFRNCAGITALALPASGLLTIDDYAFQSTGITGTLTIPSSVTTIGQNAFYDCTGLTGTLTIPSSVTYMGQNAFYNAGITTLYWLTDLAIPAGTFEYTSLNAIHISAATAPSVGSNAFYGVPDTGILYYPTGGSGYTTALAFGLPVGWTVQTINFPVLTLTANPTGLVYPATGPVTLTATLTGADDNGSKLIVFTMNGTPIGSPVNTDAGGVATITVTGLTVGTYNFGASFAGDASNAQATDIIAGYTVAKADATVLTATAAATLTYDGSAQTLVSGGTASGGIMEYSLTSGSGFGISIPSGTNAGLYTVYYRVTGDANHNDVAEVLINVTIQKAAGATVSNPTVTGLPTAWSITVSAVTVTPPNPGSQSVEYAVSASSGVTPASGWQAGTTFNGLASGTTYYVYARTVGNANYETGAVSESAPIMTAVIPPFVATTTLPAGTGGTPYSYTLIATGTAPISWSLDGGTSLPAGLTLNQLTGVIAGTPVAAGTTSFTVKASNGAAPDDTRSLSITVTGNVISVGTSAGGSVTVDKPSAQAGETVRLTVTPASGYTLSGLFIFKTGDANTSVAFSGRDGVYTFVMPAYDVTVTAHFELQPPPLIMRPVTLKLPAGITSQPAAGIHHIQSGSDFTFTLTLPAGQVPTVKTNRLIQGEQEVLTGVANDDGTYTFTVRQIRQTLEITVSSSVGNDAVSASDVWSYGGKLYVRTAKAATIYIYTAAGQLLRQQQVDAGETVIGLPQGVYVVVVDGKRWKISV